MKIQGRGYESVVDCVSLLFEKVFSNINNKQYQQYSTISDDIQQYQTIFDNIRRYLTISDNGQKYL